MWLLVTITKFHAIIGCPCGWITMTSFLNRIYLPQINFRRSQPALRQLYACHDTLTYIFLPNAGLYSYFMKFVSIVLLSTLYPLFLSSNDSRFHLYFLNQTHRLLKFWTSQFLLMFCLLSYHGIENWWPVISRKSQNY